jgi:hypothetical protein
MATTYDFTGANGDPLPSGLVARQGAWEISGNAVAATGAEPAAPAWVVTTTDATQVGTELSDGTRSINWTAVTSTPSSGGLVFRYSDISNLWLALINPDTATLSLFSVNQGSFAFIGSYTIPSFNQAATYNIEAVLNGTSIDIRLDGISRITHTSSFNQTAVYNGFRTSSTNHRMDNFSTPTRDSVNGIIPDPVDEFIQRESGNITLSVSGTYTGTPTSIRRKVVYTDDGTTVAGFDWATYIASPSSGAFIGANIVLPQSTRQYRVDLDFSNDATVTASTNGFMTADKWLLYGQSLAARFTDDGTDVVANALSKYADPVTGAYSTPTTGNGGTTYLNNLVTETGFAQVLVNTGIGAMTLLEVNKVSENNFLWDPLNPDTVRYLEVKAAYAAIGSKIAGAIYLQGESDAIGGLSLGDYGSSLTAHFAQLRADTRAGLPILIGVLGRTNFAMTDAEWNTVQQSHIDVANADANIYPTQKYDLPLLDGIHLTFAANIPLANRLSNSATNNILGGSADWQSPVVANIQAVSNTTTRINLTQGQGTDFTPTTGITGIELTEAGDAYAVSGITAARETATSILVTHNAAIVTVCRLYYGKEPVITGILLDNSTLNLPIVPTTLNVTAADVTAPIITVSGNATTTIPFNGTAPTFTSSTDDGSAVVVGGDTVNTGVAGTYVITFNSTDASGNVATQVTRTVIVQAEVVSNTAPTIAAIGNQSVSAGQSVTVTAIGSDVDSDALTYAFRQVSGTSVTLTQSANTVSFTAPSDANTHSIVIGVIANDGAENSAEVTTTISVAAISDQMSIYYSPDAILIIR